MTSSSMMEPGSARLYDVLHARYIDPAEGIPAQETLDEIVSALLGANEFLVDPVFEAILSIVREGEANSVTFEEIGRLVVAADLIADAANYLRENAAKISVAARGAYTIATGHDDRQATTMFSEHGFVIDEDRFAHELAGRFGGDA